MAKDIVRSSPVGDKGSTTHTTKTEHVHETPSAIIGMHVDAFDKTNPISGEGTSYIHVTLQVGSRGNTDAIDTVVDIPDDALITSGTDIHSRATNNSSGHPLTSHDEERPDNSRHERRSTSTDIHKEIQVTDSSMCLHNSSHTLCCILSGSAGGLLHPTDHVRGKNSVDSFYYMAHSETTVGFGDFHPHTTFAKLMALLLTAWGHFALSLIVSPDVFKMIDGTTRTKVRF